MFVGLNIVLRRRRRRIAVIAAMLTLAGAVVTAHSVMGADHMGDATAICLAVVETAVRLVEPPGRLVVVFQPHLYSRTLDFATELGAGLAPADVVVVMDVYAAREDPVPGVSGQLVADAVSGARAEAEVHYVPSWSEVSGVVAGLARPGDLVLTVGAGDVTMVGPEVLRLLGEGSQ